MEPYPPNGRGTTADFNHPLWNGFWAVELSGRASPCLIWHTKDDDIPLTASAHPLAGAVSYPPAVGGGGRLMTTASRLSTDPIVSPGTAL